MDSSKKFLNTKKKSPNKLRTKLLLLENSEIIRIRKTNCTLINSRDLREFEKFYSDLNNNNAIELKVEKFVSRDFTDIIQQNIIKEKFILKSPDGNNLMKFNNHNTKGNLFEYDLLRRERDEHFKNNWDKKALFLENLGIENKKVSDRLRDSRLLDVSRKRSVISSKKNMFFIINTLKKHTNSDSENENNFVFNAPKKIDYDKNIQLINFDDDKFLNLPQTKKRYEQGLNYLRQLVKRLKINKKKSDNNKLKVSLNEVTQTIKEKIGLENGLVEMDSANSPSSLNKIKDCKRNSNQSYKSDKTTNYILKVNDEIISDRNVKEFSSNNQNVKSNNNSNSDKKEAFNSYLNSSIKSSKDKETQGNDGNQKLENSKDSENNYFKNKLNDINSQRRKSNIYISSNFSQSSKHFLNIDYCNLAPGKNSNDNIKNTKNEFNSINIKLPDPKNKKSSKNIQNKKNLNDILDDLNDLNTDRPSKNNLYLNTNKNNSNPNTKRDSKPNSNKASKFNSKSITPRNDIDEEKRISPKRKNSNSSKDSNKDSDEDYPRAKTERELKPHIQQKTNLGKLSSDSIRKVGDLVNKNNTINNNNNISNNAQTNDKTEKKNKFLINKIDFSKLHKKEQRNHLEEDNKNSCQKIFYSNPSNSHSNSNSDLGSNSEKNNKNSYESDSDSYSDYFNQKKDRNQLVQLKSESSDSSDSETVSEDSQKEEFFNFAKIENKSKAKNKPMTHRVKNPFYFNSEANSGKNSTDNHIIHYNSNEEKLFTNSKVNLGNKSPNAQNNFPNKNPSNFNRNFLDPERIYNPKANMENRLFGVHLDNFNDSKRYISKTQIPGKDEILGITRMKDSSKALTPCEKTNGDNDYKTSFLDLVEKNNKFNNFNNSNGDNLKKSTQNSFTTEVEKAVSEKPYSKKDLKNLNRRSSIQYTLTIENINILMNNINEDPKIKKQETRKILNESYSHFDSTETTYNSSNLNKKSVNTPSRAKAEKEVLEHKKGFGIKLNGYNLKN